MLGGCHPYAVLSSVDDGEGRCHRRGMGQPALFSPPIKNFSLHEFALWPPKAPPAHSPRLFDRLLRF